MKELRKILFAACVLCAINLQAQKKLMIEKGEVDFTSNAKLELIKASSKDVKGVIDPASGQFAFIVKIQSFEGFNSSLQREHFNEKYLEADKYYDATFSGKIMEAVDFTKDGVYDVNASGNLIIHGKKKQRTIPSKLHIDKGVVTIVSNFTVLLTDHDIKIPNIVKDKISPEILVKLNAVMAQQ